MPRIPLDAEIVHAVFCNALGLPITATQDEIAGHLGIAQTLYSRVCRGERVSAPGLASRLQTVGLNDVALEVLSTHNIYVDAMAKANERWRAYLGDEINRILTTHLNGVRELG